MSNASDARRAHDVLDGLFEGRVLPRENEQLLRSFLPDRPKDATLEDLLTCVHAAWLRANPSDWGFDTPAEHHDWLFDLRNDLVRILQEQDTPAAEPENVAATVHSLPAGMRLAEHAVYGRVVTSPKPNRDGIYDLLVPKPKFETGADWEYAHECELTFIDAEPAAPTHPEFLETEADYAAAPEGTIVACDDSPPCHKFGSEWSSVLFYGMKDDRGMSRAIRRVLRWGWANE